MSDNAGNARTEHEVATGAQWQAAFSGGVVRHDEYDDAL